MATVLITFDGGNVPIVSGAFPPDEQTPIADPVQTGETANAPFSVEAGVYCYGLQTDKPYTPLWHEVQAVDGVQATAHFRLGK